MKKVFLVLSFALAVSAWGEDYIYNKVDLAKDVETKTNGLVLSESATSTGATAVDAHNAALEACKSKLSLLVDGYATAFGIKTFEVMYNKKPRNVFAPKRMFFLRDVAFISNTADKKINLPNAASANLTCTINVRDGIIGEGNAEFIAMITVTE